MPWRTATTRNDLLESMDYGHRHVTGSQRQTHTHQTGVCDTLTKHGRTGPAEGEDVILQQVSLAIPLAEDTAAREIKLGNE